MTPPCGNGVSASASTPVDTTNVPGLNTLVYRVGTYASFFATMKARLSSPEFNLVHGGNPLLGLKTRDSNDPAIALLDAWAVVADVLTFYQERIANEGYLRTATERRSVLELAALVGHAVRPGVASSTSVAYTFDGVSNSTVVAGSKVQSVPGPGELPQTFETSEDLRASAGFSNLTPRLTRPQIFGADTKQAYVAGVANNLNPNDPVIVIASPPAPFYIETAEVQPKQNRTLVTFQTGQVKKTEAKVATTGLDAIESLLGPLATPAAAHPTSFLQLPRKASDVFKPDLDTAPTLIQALNPQVGAQLYAALKNASVTPIPTSQIHALRVKAGVFGSNAVPKQITDPNGIVIGTEDWPLNGNLSITLLASAVVQGIRGSREFLAEKVLTKAPTHESSTLFVKIVEGNRTATATLAPTLGSFRVGQWEIVITADKGVGRVSFPGLKRTYTLESDPKAGAIDLKSDDGQILSLLPGQKATSDLNGRHILGSFTETKTEQGSTTVLELQMLVVDDSALALESGSDAGKIINLDGAYDKIVPGSYALVVRADIGKTVATTVTKVAQLSMSAYGISTRVTQLTLDEAWLQPSDLMLSVARSTTVFAQSEQLQLSEEPISDDVAGSEIELGDLYQGLQPGRWVIVKGERSDVPGVVSSELMMVTGVEQRASSPTGSAWASGSDVPQNSPGESIHSFLKLSNSLAYKYKRDSVSVYGNVVRATHGETRNEVLGSGDSAVPLQQFVLHQAPLTYVPAATPDGTASTLRVYVNGVEWHEVDSLAGAGPSDRCFVTHTDDSDKVTITFGDGVHGMRLPTGAENVKATYRAGIGEGGNVNPEKISMLSTKPLGARAVVNPVPATGGAERDSSDTARRNTPTASIALDRLVSVQDYAEFAKTFGGVGKAVAGRLSLGGQQVVFVTIAGSEGAVIDPLSELVPNLMLSFRQFGDPHQPVAIGICRFLFVVISAQVKVSPDYQWTSVAPQVKNALLTRFGFDQQQLGQPVYLSSVMTAIQQVEGVAYVLVNGLNSVSSEEANTATSLTAKFAELASERPPKSEVEARAGHFDVKTGAAEPAELAFLNPDLPDTLLLTEITT